MTTKFNTTRHNVTLSAALSRRSALQKFKLCCRPTTRCRPTGNGLRK